jgi:hypothetical protein
LELECDVRDTTPPFDVNREKYPLNEALGNANDDMAIEMGLPMRSSGFKCQTISFAHRFG